jgi:acetolactate synthase-1/2/3 large subunit
VREGIDVVFGIPGGAVIPLYHFLRDYPIRLVLMRHEQAAIHSADGYARVTGRVGVCMITSGPGATNLVTGLATARAASPRLWHSPGRRPPETPSGLPTARSWAASWSSSVAFDARTTLTRL